MNRETRTSLECVQRSLPRRYRAERGFRWLGAASIAVALAFLVLLIGSILWRAAPAFTKTDLRLTVTFDPERLGVALPAEPQALLAADCGGLIKAALRERFPEVRGRGAQRELYRLVSEGAGLRLCRALADRPERLGRSETVWVLADDEVDNWMKSDGAEGRLSDAQRAWLTTLAAAGDLRLRFNWELFTNGDSRNPELAGIRAALLGSFYTLLITLLLSFPLGVSAAIYLEEFAPRNRWTDLIEVNINNLAAVPSIVFGLLGLAVFIGFLGLPRSAPIVGGLVLTLMTLPTVIIASRAAIQAVPPSIREAALGLGASPMQTVLHHVLPLALPGMLTGTIIGMARALGETAPLLMIGMVAFIVDPPQGVFDPATALPVQIYLWTDSPERAYTALAAAAIVVLLVFLVLMNLAAVILRRKFERRW